MSFIPMKEFFQAAFQWLSKYLLSPRFLALYAFLSALLLFVPRHWLAAFGLDTFAAHYTPFLVVALVCSSFLLLWDLGVSGWERDKARRHVKKYLKTISMDEILILQRFVDSGNKTEYFAPGDGTVVHLGMNGILYSPANQYNLMRGEPWTVTETAYPFLQREKFQALLNRQTEELNKKQKSR